MPDMIDKSNALDWASANNVSDRIMRYCEFMALHGRDSIPVKILKGFDTDNCVWLCIEKTGERQTTRSFEVYVMGKNFVETRMTVPIAAVCKVDRNGLVKVNFWTELEQVIKFVDPYATIRRF